MRRALRVAVLCLASCGGFEFSTDELQVFPDSDYTTTLSGLKYYDFIVGSGFRPEKGQEITIHYTRFLTDG